MDVVTHIHTKREKVADRSLPNLMLWCIVYLYLLLNRDAREAHNVNSTQIHLWYLTSPFLNSKTVPTLQKNLYDDVVGNGESDRNDLSTLKCTQVAHHTWLNVTVGGYCASWYCTITTCSIMATNTKP